MHTMNSITLEQARADLEKAGLTGHHHSHSRGDTINKIRAMLDGDVEARFGISGVDRYSVEDVLGFVAELTGCSPDPAQVHGVDFVDPERTVNAIHAAAQRLRKEAEASAALLAVTGHPTGLLEHHVRVVDAYRSAGGTVVRTGEGTKLPFGRGRAEIRYNGSVGCLADGASLKHTHSAEAMEALLSEHEWPDIVLGDHGFAGAAIERGIPTIAVMDINDPALAVAWAAGKDVIVIPMDDNRHPHLYEPSWRLFEAVLSGAEA